MNVNFSALILTGGTSSRFGSDKSQALIGDHSLIENILNGMPPEVEIVIVGPRLPQISRTARFTQEEPIGGGPVAAISAGLTLIETEFVAIFATDMPFAALFLKTLIDNFPQGEDVTIPLDSQGFRQPLCALYRTNSLRRAMIDIGNVSSQSMKRLLGYLDVKELSLPGHLRRILIDVDTPSDLAQATQAMIEHHDSERARIMEKWIEAVQKELNLNVDVDEELILDLARDAAHGVERKAAPITTYLLGIAIAGGADPKAAAKGVAELAGRWSADT